MSKRFLSFTYVGSGRAHDTFRRVGHTHYNLPSLRRWQRIIAAMCGNDNAEHLVAFEMLGAHITGQEADDRMLRAGLNVLFPKYDSELVAFAMQAASWAGDAPTF